MHGDIQIPGTDDVGDFAAVKESFMKLKFSASEVDILFSILSAILHLGNITFLGEEKVTIDPKCRSTLETICNLLKVRLEKSRDTGKTEPGTRNREQGRGRGKREEGRGKREEGRGKREEVGKIHNKFLLFLRHW
jgi:hypothetical protein